MLITAHAQRRGQGSGHTHTHRMTFGLLELLLRSVRRKDGMMELLASRGASSEGLNKQGLCNCFRIFWNSFIVGQRTCVKSIYVQIPACKNIACMPVQCVCTVHRGSAEMVKWVMRKICFQCCYSSRIYTSKITSTASLTEFKMSSRDIQGDIVPDGSV